VFGTDITDVISLKRWLAFLEGGLLPIISLTSLHFFIKYEDDKPDSTTVHDTIHDTINDTPKVESGTQITDWLEEHGSPEIEEMVDYESSQYFDIQENLITNTTTTTTNDGVRRLTYSKPVNLINL
jgi:hypothetical protein